MCRCGAHGHSLVVDLAVLGVGLNDLKCLFQSEWLYGCMWISPAEWPRVYANVEVKHQ